MRHELAALVLYLIVLLGVIAGVHAFLPDNLAQVLAVAAAQRLAGLASGREPTRPRCPRCGRPTGVPAEGTRDSVSGATPATCSVSWRPCAPQVSRRPGLDRTQRGGGNGCE